MKVFPSEFASMLSPKGQAILRQGYYGKKETLKSRQGPPIELLTGVLDETTATQSQLLVDKVMYSHVRQVDSPIPKETITGMRKNYQEKLPKALRFKTALFASKTSNAYQAAAGVGLINMMRSESLALFAEAISGMKLKRNRGIQVILYEPGDYAGPHNDHHPENDSVRNGYVDLHITLTTASVADQYLVCEDRQHLSRMYPIARNGSVTVSHLPFWHYTTPLRAKRGQINDARRWLLLATFDIAEKK